MTLYSLKLRFQSLLRPLTGWLAEMGITANQVTLTAACGSLGLGALLTVNAEAHLLFLLLPVWLPIRMALNAIDGMLAREFNQKSVLGAYLNEIADVVSDAALYLPFAFVAPFSALWVGVVIFLSALSELTGVLGAANGGSRRYDGPLGKSDRALLFGGLGMVIGLALPLPLWLAWLMPGIALLLCLTIVNRVRGGLEDSARRQLSTP